MEGEGNDASARSDRRRGFSKWRNKDLNSKRIETRCSIYKKEEAKIPTDPEVGGKYRIPGRFVPQKRELWTLKGRVPKIGVVYRVLSQCELNTPHTAEYV